MEKDYVFLKNLEISHYTAEAFVIRCFDDRFWKSFKDFLKQQGFIHIDPISLAGGVKSISSPENDSDRDFILKQIEISTKLHHTKKIMLFNHHDCGAYGGFSRFHNDENKEFDFHVAELQKSKKIIQQRFPELAVEMYFIDKKGIVKI